MPTNVIMPALEMAQETGKVLRWIKSPGDHVVKGESIVEIETDKVTVEIEAPASGILRDVSAQAGDVVPVGKTIALIFAAGEAGAASSRPAAAPAAAASAVVTASAETSTSAGAVKASPLARKLAEQHGVDLTRMKTASGRIEKADVLAYVESRASLRLTAASPKARRLAAERGVDLKIVRGSGPGGAILAADVGVAKTAPAPEARRRRAGPASPRQRVVEGRHHRPERRHQHRRRRRHRGRPRGSRPPPRRNAEPRRH